MKKFLALLLALAMTLALVACGEKKDDTKTDGAGDGEKTYKVAMICDSSINDGGWGAACYNAMVKAAEDKGWTYDVTDSISQDQYYETIVAFCNLGYDMIYAPGNQYTDAVLQAAEEYPDIAFALLNGAESTPEKAANGNVASLLPNAEQIGWIAGALAGLMTESGKLGFIGGMELDTTKGKIAGFEAAAKYVGEQEGKTVELLAVPYANSFSDAPKGKEFATELISQGADVFFGDASAVDSGAREAIDAANEKAGAIKIYDIGQPADILGQNPCIICSQVTDNAAMIGVCMEAVVAGTFGGNTIFGTLENGALSAGAINTELVPAEKVEKYNAYLQQMMDGTFLKYAVIPLISPGQRPGDIFSAYKKRHGIWILHPFPCLFPVVSFGVRTFACNGVQHAPGASLHSVTPALLFFREFFIRDKLFHSVLLSNGLRYHSRPYTVCQRSALISLCQYLLRH